MEEPTRRPGRPAKPDSEKQTQRSIRFTPAEWQQIDEASAPAPGIEWVRKIVRRELTKRAARKLPREDLDE